MWVFVSGNSGQEFNQYFPVDFDEITSMVSAEFQIDEGLLEYNVPTYFLMQPQETKEAFLRLLENLESNNLIATLRRRDRRIVLKVIPKPLVKKSNMLINWILFFATIGTVFVTGYMISEGSMNPFVGGLAFTVALMATLGTHEIGHMITAKRKGIEATPPYFIPGPPPIGGMLGIGTFGAAILQKELSRNRDDLFDVGAAGPLYGFILSIIVTSVGILLSKPYYSDVILPSVLPTPLLFDFLARLLFHAPLAPPQTPYTYILLHPVAFAGWVGLLITGLQLLPAANLDGGHVARAMVSERFRMILTGVSIIFLIIQGAYPMALLLLFMSMTKHPGALDDVSKVSNSRKGLTIVLVAIFFLSMIAL